MGRSKQVYLSDEMYNRLLNEENASKLINNLLEDYFQKTDINTMSEEQLIKAIKKAELKQEFEDKLKGL
jgi:hypothetical protein